VRTIRGALDGLLLHWEAGLRRLPLFTQRTAVLLLGVLVATREHRSGIDVAFACPAAPAGPPHARRAYPAGVPAMLGGVVALVGWPGANGPAHLVPGERAGQAPESRPEPGGRPAPGSSGAGARSGADAGGATAASPSPEDAAPRATPAGTTGQRPGTTGAGAARSTAAGAQGSGVAAAGAQGSGGAAGAGAGGPPAAPPTTSPPATTTPQGPLDPVDELPGPVVSTLLP
jgi:hypothetical protein